MTDEKPKRHDPAMLNSNFERNEHEAYYTQHFCTRALLPYIPDRVRNGLIWEPAAGRGDITYVLMEDGLDVASSDIDDRYFNRELGSFRQLDFMNCPLDFDWAEDYTGLITNPPYGGARIQRYGKSLYASEAWVRRALDTGIGFVAMFLRSSFSAAGGRTDLWEEEPYAFEIRMTKRPRWDNWWEKEKPDDGPRHDFSWFVWDREWEGVSTTYWDKQEL